MTTMFKEGINVGQMIAHLQTLPKDTPFLVASDEEQNSVFKGFYVEAYDDGVVVAGLSGCEAD